MAIQTNHAVQKASVLGSLGEAEQKERDGQLDKANGDDYEKSLPKQGIE
jgi:hypothetical protein